MTLSLQPALDSLVSHRASDLHLSVGVPPVLRIAGDLHVQDGEVLAPEAIDALLAEALTEWQRDRLAADHTLDLGLTSDAGERYRINVYRERGHYALAIRWLEGTSHTLEELRLPGQIAELARIRDGLVLMTGATGSGKSTTLASLINIINESRRCHILTIEDPIEFLHENKRALVHQREVGADVGSFGGAVRSALREDPDVVLVGEMRDTETISAALTVAETGHLVFSTLHTNDAIGVLDRIIGVFPGHAQMAIRQQLSMSLRAVVTQTLVKTRDGKGRVPINEILMVNHAVAHLIREHRPEQIRSIMETGRQDGNQTLEQAIAVRIRQGLIDRAAGLAMTTRPEQLEDLLRLGDGDGASGPGASQRDRRRR
ncbi:MAG: PilT/PilU family type 4a pilus ATPase [Pseudomonadota bacterium]